MAKQKPTDPTSTPTETLEQESERILRENAERNFQAWKEENPTPTIQAHKVDTTGNAAEMAQKVAEQTLRNFGTSALAGLRAGGSFISALKGADAKAAAKAAARLSLAREKCVARRGANLRADVTESQLAAAKAAEEFMFLLGVEVAKRSDLF